MATDLELTTGSGLVLASLPLLALPSEALFDTISTQLTTAAFPMLTRFQTIFVGLALLQLFCFQMMGLIPFDLSKILNGMYTGRRRLRREVKHIKRIKLDSKIELIILQSLDALHRLDKYKCIQRALCELQSESLRGYQLPVGLNMTLEGIKLYSDLKATSESSGLNSFRRFAEVASFGRKVQPGKNSTTCEQKYKFCPITTSEVMYFTEQMQMDDFFL